MNQRIAIRISASKRNQSTLQSQRNQLRDAEIKFQKAFAQVRLLNKRLADVTRRYDNAKRDNCRCYRYHLRLKLSVLEGVISMYVAYLTTKAQHISNLRRHVRFWIEESSSESDDEDFVWQRPYKATMVHERTWINSQRIISRRIVLRLHDVVSISRREYKYS